MSGGSWMIHFVGHQKSQHAKKMFYDFSMTQHSCHAYQVSSFLLTHNVVFSFDIKDASLKNQYVFNLYVKAFGLPSWNDLGLQFLFFCQSQRVALKLDQSNPAKSFICSDLHQDKPTQFNVNWHQYILCTYWHKSICSWASNMQPASIFVVEIAVDVNVRHMMDNYIEVLYTGMQIGQGSKCLSSRERQS